MTKILDFELVDKHNEFDEYAGIVDSVVVTFLAFHDGYVACDLDSVSNLSGYDSYESSDKGFIEDVGKEYTRKAIELISLLKAFSDN